MALTYQNIIDYSGRVKTTTEQAVNELTRRVSNIGASDPEQRARFIRMHVRAVAEEYGMQEQELGAQWYEFCAEKAGVQVEAALVDEIDYERIDRHFDRILDDYVSGDSTWDDVERDVRDAFEYEMRNLERDTIIQNLDRDERQAGRRWRQTKRAAMKAGYARVPVGETCAWCLMLASLGYFYRSEETALGVEPDHYHAHCDCIAVPYSGPKSIEGYDDYDMYFDMYATARDDYNSGNISPELQSRIDAAKEKHDRDYAMGKTDRPWAPVNAITIIMREQQGLSH